MAKPVTYTWAAADTTYICAAQTASGAATLTLNGSGVDATSTYLLNNPRMILAGTGFERTVSLTSSGTVSSVTFTITGKDIRGATVTEAIAGPAANTVYTTAYFYEVDSVTTSATLGTSTSIGIGTTGRSQWFIPDYNLTPVNVGIGVTVTAGTINWTLKQTTYNPQAAEPPSTAVLSNSDPDMVAQTVSRQGNYVLPFGGSRIIVNSSTDGALVANFMQAGIV